MADKPVGDEHMGQFVYCRQHVGPHSTGWCGVEADQKIALLATTSEEARAEVKRLGYPIYHSIDGAGKEVPENQIRTCETCKSHYDVRQIYANFGSDHKKWCYGCIKVWVDKCQADPYRVGAAMTRGESPLNVEDTIVESYKQAFEKTLEMLEAQRTNNGS